MVTKLLKATPEAIAEAAEYLRVGHVVAIPTETVYGLAANALDSDAVRRIFMAKGRPQDNPLIVHVDGEEMMAPLVRLIPPGARRLAQAFWPGPLTMIMQKSDAVAPEVSAGLDTIAIRMPSHPVARAVITASGLPLAAPSANLSGGPSPTTARHVLDDMSGHIPLVIDGGESPVGLESTVISLVGEPMVLRPGYITPGELEEVLDQPVYLSPAVDGPVEEGAPVESPGMKYRHYAPKAEVIIVIGSLSEFNAYVKKKSLTQPDVFALCFEGEEKYVPVMSVTYGRKDDSASQAAALFTALRTLDELGAKTVYARQPSANGVGLAVVNRLLRAAAYRVVQL